MVELIELSRWKLDFVGRIDVLVVVLLRLRCNRRTLQHFSHSTSANRGESRGGNAVGHRGAADAA